MESRVLDVAIGLAFTFLIVSVLVSAVQEYLAGLLSMRAKNLEAGIKCLLFGTTTTGNAVHIKLWTDLSSHPLLYNLSRSEKLLSSYLPPANFSRALIDTHLEQLRKAGKTADDARSLAEAINNGPCSRLLSPLLVEANGDLAKFQKLIEEQYDHMMDRVSGWYKRHAQAWMLGIGMALAVMLNVDAIRLTQTLWSDAATRTAVVELAATSVSSASQADPYAVTSVQRFEADLDNTTIEKLPIGWPTVWMGEQKDAKGQVVKPDGLELAWAIFISLLGWFITALAASLGAPFWFDLVGKLVKLRSAGATPAKSVESAGGGAVAPATASISGAASVPATTAASAPPSPNERNAIVDLHWEKNKGDESYAPITEEGRFQ